MTGKLLFLCALTLFPAFSVWGFEPAAGPPPAEIKAELSFPSLGTKWVGRVIFPNGPTVTLNYMVLEDGAYEGKSVHRISAGPDTILYDKETGNVIASFRAGKEMNSTFPHDGTLNWPLYVGKSWTATYTYNNRLQGMSVGPLNVQYRATAYEDITVPAGSWKAFRIDAEGVNNVTTTLWYVPEISLIVKKIAETMLGHPMGQTKTVFEIIEYHQDDKTGRNDSAKPLAEPSIKTEQRE